MLRLAVVSCGVWLLLASAGSAAAPEEKPAGPDWDPVAAPIDRGRRAVSESIKPWVFRIDSENFFEEGGAWTSNNILRLRHGGPGGFELGYEKQDDGNQQAYAVRLPFGKHLDWKHGLDLFAWRSELGSTAEHEALVSYRPHRSWELIGRWYDLVDDEGDRLAASVQYRMDPDWNAPVNGGFGLQVSTSTNRNESGYVWGQTDRLGGIFFGIARYGVPRIEDDVRVVVGRPNPGGGLAWRFFGRDRNDGFEFNQLLFTTSGVVLTTRNFISSLVPIKLTDSFTSGGGPFQFQPPPTAARGRGITAGAIHRKFPSGRETLEAEVVNYFGNLYVGVSHAYTFHKFEQGTYGLPFGYAFGGGDLLTRNFVRVHPRYTRATNDFALEVLMETKF